MDDLQKFAADVRERYAGKYPMFIGGHSMGALTAIYTALKDQNVWSGVVVCSGALDVDWNLGRRYVSSHATFPWVGKQEVPHCTLPFVHLQAASAAKPPIFAYVQQA